MIKSLFTFAALALLLGISVSADEPLLSDDFSTDKHPTRRAMRGDWQFDNNIASCVQDDELYKKYKDHGPIIFYDLKYDDVTVSFSFKTEDAKSFVFTANGEDGHVFRFVLSPKGLGIRAFPPDSETKSVSAGREKDMVLSSGEWADVMVTLKGDNATVKIGKEFDKTYQHASFDRPKKNLSAGFSFGKLSVRDLKVTK